jgi:hypothetical protein
MDDEPKNADEFLQRESQSARDALKQLRGEMLDSLKRTADAAAWTKRYPWQSLGTAAIAGLGTGWALGKTFRRNPSTERAASENQPEQAAAAAESAESPSAASRLVGGLGTLTGALASAAFTAAAESLKDLVTNSVHSALNPDVDPNATTDEENGSVDDLASDPPSAV